VSLTSSVLYPGYMYIGKYCANELLELWLALINQVHSPPPLRSLPLVWWSL
jgi:hypothetical protein